MKPSSRSEIAPFYVMEVMKAAADRERHGGDVLHLEVGQPMTPAPARVRQAAAASIGSDRLGYTHALGHDDLRDRIAQHHRDEHGYPLDASRVAVTVGASGGFVLALLAAFDVGARIGITEPGYAAYRNIIQALGLELVGVRVGPDTRYVPTPERLDAVGPLDGLVIASPSNPTGTTLTPGEVSSVVTWCEDQQVRLVSDEIYHGITYGAPAPSVLGRSESAIVVQSFSKYYSMTGWRLGWLVLPPELVRPVERLAQNLFISPPAISQLAAVTAFDCRDELDANVGRYARGRTVLLEGLARAGITGLAPADGAFYVWADVSHLDDDSRSLCRRWLDDIGVAATPGVDFDPGEGRRFVRFSYSESPGDVAEAVGRIGEWVRSLERGQRAGLFSR